jgi:hypothetical protein
MTAMNRGYPAALPTRLVVVTARVLIFQTPSFF